MGKNLSNTIYYVYSRSKRNIYFSEGNAPVCTGIMTKKESVSGTINIGIPAGANKIKVMMWDNLNTMKPVAFKKSIGR